MQGAALDSGRQTGTILIVAVPYCRTDQPRRWLVRVLAGREEGYSGGARLTVGRRRNLCLTAGLWGETMLFQRKKKTIFYDKTGKYPVIRASICTGEQVAGFRDEKTGKFSEIMLIRDEADLREFMEDYSVIREEIRREW